VGVSAMLVVKRALRVAMAVALVLPASAAFSLAQQRSNGDAELPLQDRPAGLPPSECLWGPKSPDYDPRICGKPRLAAPPECQLGYRWPGYDPRLCVEPVDKSR